MAATIALARREGTLQKHESALFENVLRFEQIRVDDVMTPRTVAYMLPQETSIFRGLSVAENILAVLEARGVPKRQRQERVDELLEELHLQERARQRADTLSGGETRRVEIARALAIEPRYILLDEPFTGIDPRTVEDIQTIIGDLRNENLSILITDHNVRETLQITDRAYIMVDGRILTAGTARELTSNDQVRRLYLGERFQMDW